MANAIYGASNFSPLAKRCSIQHALDKFLGHFAQVTFTRFSIKQCAQVNKEQVRKPVGLHGQDKIKIP